jgi:predicted lipoprotein with Yx(FWY)xxD motif
MKRICVLMAGLLVAAACAAAIAGARPASPAARASRAASVQLRHTSLGEILVSSSGQTLYEFTRDHSDHDSCASVKGCSQVWPALRESGKPTTGPGLRASLLSTIAVAGGVRQLTYAGHPLYTYSGAYGAGETSYVGAKQFGGSWYALSASGAAVR